MIQKEVYECIYGTDSVIENKY